MITADLQWTSHGQKISDALRAPACGTGDNTAGPSGRVAGRYGHALGRLFRHRDGGRIYVAKVGPWGLIVLAALALLVAAAVVVFLIGALLIWVPIVAVLVSAGILFGKMRQAR